MMHILPPGRTAFILAALLLATPAMAQDAQPAPAKPAPAAKPGPLQLDADPPPSDTWIFSGTLQGSNESYSGTLVATKDEGMFEMKLGGGATCDGNQFKGGLGMVKLPEITCTDDRVMRALFVPQGGNVLKVFGHVGDERFMAEAHLLGTEAVPEPKQTAQPKGPLGLPPRPPGGPAPAPK